MTSAVYNRNKTESKDTTISITDEEKALESNATPKSTCRRKSLVRGVKEIWREFCANTSIHGFQYFGQQRPRKEIIFWIIVFVTSIYFCSSIIVGIYVKWRESPVIVTFSERSTPVWKIPFPRVTICPENKRTMNGSRVPSFFQLVNSLRVYLQQGKEFQSNFTTTDLEDVLTLMQLCNVATEVELPSFEHEVIDYIEIINKLMPDISRYCFSGLWFGVEKSCDKLYTRIYTEDGVCFTFNGLLDHDLYREHTIQYQRSLNSSLYHKVDMFQNLSLSWSLEQGYHDDGDLNTYPGRVLGSGAMAGFLSVLQGFAEELDYSCRYVPDGFKVMLHSPDDVPTMGKHFVHVSMDKDVMIAVKPKMITPSAGIAAYTPHKRQCYLSKDRQLKFFKIYSRNNCELECLTNFTYHRCGCVTFAMPRSAETPVCGANKISCYRMANEKLLFQQFTQDWQSKRETSIGTLENCDCLPACTSLDYETEISEAVFHLENHLNAVGDYAGFRVKYPGMAMSVLWVYFKEPHFITSRRSELYGVTDLLANFGGAFGLFMGFSLLSVVEICYHFTLRLWSNVGRHQIGV